MNTEKTKNRFFDRVMFEPNTGCWLWMGRPDGGGVLQRDWYGAMRVGGVAYKAHRLSYELFVAPIPEGMCILHKCDVRSCVNPDHLAVGTREDNNADMTTKGRRATGSRHPDAKLTERDVVAIRNSPVPAPAIARQYGILRSAIYQLRAGKTWKHVPLRTKGGTP